MSKMTVFGLTEASRVRCSVEFLQIFLKEVATREQFSAAVSLLYTALQGITCKLTKILEKCFLLEVICPPAQGSWWWMWTTDGRKK